MAVAYPLISILVLCYNNQEYLYENIASVFAQTYPNIEILINDDGSADFDGIALDAWINENKTPNIRNVLVNHSQANYGTTSAVHYLQTIANGTWLFNIAADDVLYDKNVIMSMYNTAVQHGDNAQVIMAQTLMYDNTLSKVIQPFMSKQNIEFLKTASMEQLLNRTVESPWLPASYLYSHSTLCFLGDIHKIYRLVEDVPAHIRFLRNGIRPYFCDITAAIKHRDGGVSKGAINCTSLSQLAYKRDMVSIYEIDVIPYIGVSDTSSSSRNAMHFYSYIVGDDLMSHITYVVSSKHQAQLLFYECFLISLSRKKGIYILSLSSVLFFLLSLLTVDFNVSVLLDSICYIPFLMANVLFLICICVTIFNIYNRNRR